MPRMSRAVLVLAAVAAVLSNACASQAVLEATDEPPAVVEAVEGSAVRQVTLTEDAEHRLGIATAAVQTSGGNAVVPTAAVLYDANGKTWVFTNPRAHVYIRAEVGIDEIKGDSTVLSAGPPADTLVVTVGVAELFGAESGVGDPE